MPSSDTEICNLALGHLGEGQIVSLADGSAAARACALHYGTVRDALLRSHRWNFAQDRATLAALASAPAFGWAYQYPLPVECLRVLEINGSEVNEPETHQYLIEGRKILTNASTADVVYIRRIEDVTQYDALFVEAFALKLAVKLTESIRGTTGKTAELLQEYERLTAPLARRVDANEGRRRKGLMPQTSMAIRARAGGYFHF